MPEQVVPLHQPSANRKSAPRESTSPNTSERGEKGRWLPGTSPNPGGRPKAGDHVRDMARRHTDKAIETLYRIMTDGKSETAQAAAANALLDRGWGRSNQPLVGADDAPSIGVAVEDREAAAARKKAAAQELLSDVFGPDRAAPTRAAMG